MAHAKPTGAAIAIAPAVTRRVPAISGNAPYSSADGRQLLPNRKSTSPFSLNESALFDSVKMIIRRTIRTASEEIPRRTHDINRSLSVLRPFFKPY